MPDSNKLSFRNKLRVAFLIVTILSILITGGFSYYITANIIETNALKLTQDSVVQSAQTVDEKLGKLMLVLMTFMISEQFQDMLKDATAGNDRDYYTHMTNMNVIFSQARIAESLIHSIYISTPIGAFYPLTMGLNPQSSFLESNLYTRMQGETGNAWFEGHVDTLFTDHKRVISLILQPIAEYYSVKDVYVVVNIREDGLRKLVGTQSEGGAIRLLLNKEGDPVYSYTDPVAGQLGNGDLMSRIASDGMSGYESYKLDDETYLLNYASIQINDWTLVSIQSKDDVLKDMIYVQWMILTITAASFLVTLFISGAFTRYLLKPLQRLQQVMKRVEHNDLSARFESRNSDELAQVGFRFNRMLDQLVHMIEEVKSAEASKRSAEIKALSAQIDPHFLYNTLNTIYWKLKLNQVTQSQQMVVALSRLFQLGLNKGQELTTLAKEVDHVKQYLELQKNCYENLFDYDIQVLQPRLLELPVPRIILQPLVENCILHGFRSMERDGYISIHIEENMQDRNWTISVKDNGAGMDERTVESLLKQDPEQGYAVRNLLSRLYLYYGDSAQLTITSILEEGTTIFLTIPYNPIPR